MNEYGNYDTSILSCTHEELYCDKHSLLHLLIKFFVAQNKKQHNLCHRQHDFSNKLYLKIIPDNQSFSFTHLNECIDKTFQDSISECFIEFTSITLLIITREVINSLVDLCVSCIPEHYRVM